MKKLIIAELAASIACGAFVQQKAGVVVLKDFGDTDTVDSPLEDSLPSYAYFAVFRGFVDKSRDRFIV